VRQWVLNLDAEDELAHHGAHTPSEATVGRIRKIEPVLRASGLVREGDVVVFPGPASPLAQASGDRLCWCPTRWALSRFDEPPPAPPMEVLRRVNHRRFSAELGLALPGSRFVTSLGELEATFAASAQVENWLLKRPFGYAGRGRKRLRASGVRTVEEQAWIAVSIEIGGLQVEPLVRRSLDVGLHGEISMAGALTRGEVTIQEIADSGAWKATRVAATGELSVAELESLTAQFQLTAKALVSAGYFGPFGIDAFRYDGDRFQPRSEINARYSMGWAVGMRAHLPR
jgi:hypothetical protein